MVSRLFGIFHKPEEPSSDSSRNRDENALHEEIERFLQADMKQQAKATTGLLKEGEEVQGKTDNKDFGEQHEDKYAEESSEEENESEDEDEQGKVSEDDMPAFSGINDQYGAARLGVSQADDKPRMANATANHRNDREQERLVLPDLAELDFEYPFVSSGTQGWSLNLKRQNYSRANLFLAVLAPRTLSRFAPSWLRLLPRELAQKLDDLLFLRLKVKSRDGRTLHHFVSYPQTLKQTSLYKGDCLYTFNSRRLRPNEDIASLGLKHDDELEEVQYFANPRAAC
jgi:hypothetical protein